MLMDVQPDHLLQTIERFVNGSIVAKPAASSNGGSAAGQKAAVEGLFQLFIETASERLSKIESALARHDRYTLQQ